MFEFLDFQVRDVMSSAVCVGPEATLAEVEQILEERGFNGLPVVSEGRLVGFVTSLDLLRAFDSDESTLPPYHEIMRRPVTTIMRGAPVSVTPRTPLTRALARMVDTRMKSFPVIDADDRLVGIVAREDVMQGLRRADAGESPGEP